MAHRTDYPFLWGAQYYRAPTPEPECWEQDLRRMRELGCNCVKLWVQWRWSHRAEGRFYFDDLDQLMDLAATNGLRVHLNTVFDVAPLWLFDRYLDARQVCCDGTVVEPCAVNCRQIGGVPGPCYNHPGALAERQKFMDAVIRHFRAHPAMDMWDVWNEPEQALIYRHPDLAKTVCYCTHCRDAFRGWLATKYGDIGVLNRVWGRCYGEWQQVELPRNPSASFTDLVDWREFHLDTMTREANWRLGAVKAADPDHVAYLHVVPNTIRIFNAVTCVDDFALAQECDVFAGTTFAGAVFPTQLVSAANGRVTYNVECHINGGQTSMHPKMVELQDLRRELIPQVGIGVRGFMFWQFRAEVLGGESPAWGLVKLDGSDRPATVAAREFWRVLEPHSARLMCCPGPRPQIGIWKSRRNEIFHFGLSALGNLADGIDAYTEHLYWNNYPCRYLDSAMLEATAGASMPGGLDGIRLLIMPNGYYLSEAEAEALDRWVRGGGVLLCDAHLAAYNATTGRHSRTIPGCGLAPRWGVCELDSTAAVHLKQSLGREAFAEAMSADVRKALEHFGTTGGRFYPIRLTGGTLLAGCDRFAVLSAPGATVEGTYGDGTPVIVSKSIGAGRLIYCGTNAGQGAAKAPAGFLELLRRATDGAGVRPVLGCRLAEPGSVRVDALGGTSGSPEFIAVCNRTQKPQTLRLAGSGRFRGLYSAMDFVLTAEAEVCLPPDFAELLARAE